MKPLCSISIATVLLTVSAASAEDISSCGRSVLHGVLTTDLDCSAETGCPILIRDKGTLDLAGHTITVGGICGVACDEDCTIEGNGGSVVSTGLYGIHSAAERGRLTVSDLTSVGGNYAIVGGSVVVENSNISLANFGVFGRRAVTVRSSQVADNIDGITSQRHAYVNDTTITGNVRGVYAHRKADVLNVTITDNDYVGIVAWKVKATTSTVTGNGGEPSCSQETYGCVDLLSRQNPNVVDVTCDTSERRDKNGIPTGTSWGICSLD